MRHPLGWLLCLVGVVVTTACFDGGVVVDSAALRCTSGPECPAPLACAAGRCVAADSDCIVVGGDRTADPVSDGVSCGVGGDGICVQGACETPRCGDGIVTAAIAETCDDADDCRPDCTRCGDAVIDAGETCDDGDDNSDERPGACRVRCEVATCGDGVTDPGEACDDGADNDDGRAGACRTGCTLASCGDGVVDSGESCDDGVTNDDLRADACRTHCVPASCGDSAIDTGETCDDGRANSDVQASACRTTCIPARCGDGVRDAGEGCDKGGANSDTAAGACRQDCRPARCGDGVVDALEACDDGDDNNDVVADACRTTCRVATCGDAVVDDGEACDDGVGNADARAGACRTTCLLPRCGDGVRDPGEGCDRGLLNDDGSPDGCRTTCALSTCGDGVVDGTEACDDGEDNSDVAAAACRTTCVEARCGDGVVDPDEVCDEGLANNDIRVDACRTDCQPARCGDGALDSGEACDDGDGNNDTRPDACRRDCALPRCGDGVTDAVEVCDDGGEPLGCRGDCFKLAVCGNGIVDEGEDCDDANDNGVDECAACAALRYVATPLIGPAADQRTPDEIAIAQVGGVAVGPNGAVVWTEILGNVVRQARGGRVSVVAGWGSSDFFGNGFRALGAGVPGPTGLAIDPVGRVALVDRTNHQVRVVDLDGMMRQAAGTSTAGSTGDGGAAIAARVNGPIDVAYDGLGNLFIAEASGFRIRRVSTEGIIETVAGTGVSGATGDNGPAVSATVNPFSLAVDRARGRVFISDLANRRVRVIEPDGIIRRFAGSGAAGSSGDGGQAIAAAVSPRGLAVDEGGAVFIVDAGHRVRRVGLDGVITTVAGTGIAGSAGDGGPATVAQLSTPVDVDVDASGRLFIAENDTTRIRVVDAGGIIDTAVGSGFFGDVDAVATESTLFSPPDARFDRQGRLVFLSPSDRRVVRRELDGTQTVLGGNGSRTAPVDGELAVATGLPGVASVAVDVDDSLIVALSQNHLIVRVVPGGTVTRVAGTGVAGFSGDGGPATAAALNQPFHVALDDSGRLYISDAGNARVRRVESDGTISTVAGSGVTAGFAGDGGAATAARLGRPFAVRGRPDGSFVVADLDNQRIREVSVDGVIRTIVGTGARAFSTDGAAATASAIADPLGLAFDLQGRLLFTDSATRRVRRVEVNGTLRTIVGTGFSGFSGDGGAPELARLTTPRSIDVDAAGRLVLTDQGANVIRLVDPAAGTISTVAGRVHPAMTGREGTARIVDGRHGVSLGDGRFLLTQGQTGRLAVVRPLAGVVEGVLGYDPLQGGSQALAATFRFGLAVGIARVADRVYVIDEFGAQLQELVINENDLSRSVTSSRLLPFLRKPGGLAFDADQNTLLVADAGDHCVRHVGLDGLEGPTLVGQCGILGRSDDGDVTDVLLDTPTAIRRLPSGEVYFIEAGRHRVRLVRDGFVETVVGIGEPGLSLRSRAGETALDGPRDLIVDDHGNLFISTDGGVVVVADVDGDGVATASDLAVPIFRGDSAIGTACPGPLLLDEGTLVVVDRCSGGAAALTSVDQ